MQCKCIIFWDGLSITKAPWASENHVGNKWGHYSKMWKSWQIGRVSRFQNEIEPAEQRPREKGEIDNGGACMKKKVKDCNTEEQSQKGSSDSAEKNKAAVETG